MQCNKFNLVTAKKKDLAAELVNRRRQYFRDNPEIKQQLTDRIIAQLMLTINNRLLIGTHQKQKMIQPIEGETTFEGLCNQIRVNDSEDAYIYVVENIIQHNLKDIPTYKIFCI